MVDLNLTTLNTWLNKQEAVEHFDSLTDLTDWLFKAVSAESVAEAKRRGLVPQSGDWEKPRRWVLGEDADVVEELDAPRVYSYDEVKKFVEDKITFKFDFDEMREKYGRRNIFGDDDPEDDYYLGYDQIEDILEVVVGSIDGGELGPSPEHVYEGFGEPKRDRLHMVVGGREGKRNIPKWQIDSFTGTFQLEWDESPEDEHLSEKFGGEFGGGHVKAHCDADNNIVLWRTKNHVTYGQEHPPVRHQVLAETMVHELAHTFYSNSTSNVPSWIRAHVTNAYNTAVESEKGFVSKYSTVNPIEFFAECFKTYISKTDLLERTNPEMFELFETLNQADSMESLERPFTEEDFDKYDLKNMFSLEEGDFSNAFSRFENFSSDRPIMIATDKEEYESSVKQQRKEALNHMYSAIKNLIATGYVKEDLMGLLDKKSNDMKISNEKMRVWLDDPNTEESIRETFSEYDTSRSYEELYPNVRPIFEELVDNAISKYPDYGNVEPWISMFGRKDINVKKQDSSDIPTPLEQGDDPIGLIIDPIDAGYSIDEESIREASEFIREQKEEQNLSKQSHNNLRAMNPPSRPPYEGAVWNPDTHRWTKGKEEDLDKQEGGSLSIADAKSRGLKPKTGDWKKPGRWIKKPDDDKEERVKSLTQPKSPIAQELKKFNDKVEKILKTLDDLFQGRVDNPQQTFDELTELKEEVDQDSDKAKQKVQSLQEKIDELHGLGKITDEDKIAARKELADMKQFYEDQDQEVRQAFEDENYEKLREKLEAQEKESLKEEEPPLEEDTEEQEEETKDEDEPSLEEDEEDEDEDEEGEEGEENEEDESSLENDAKNLIDTASDSIETLKDVRDKSEKALKWLEDKLSKVSNDDTDLAGKLAGRVRNIKNKIDKFNNSISRNSNKIKMAKKFLDRVAESTLSINEDLSEKTKDYRLTTVADKRTKE